MNWKILPRRRSPDEEATAWLARRDRGTSPREQDDYLQWLREDPEHPRAIARAEATLRRLLQLSAWRREHGSEPNPDLLARPLARQRWLAPSLSLAAAVLLLLGLIRFAQFRAPAPGHHQFLRVNEFLQLSDGSRVELRDGTRLEACYTAGERRVRLTGGEAQFSVLKDPARPFIVEASGVAVRAVGTVFAVRLGGATVDVLVTEGKVRVGPVAAGEAMAGAPLVFVGQRAVVPLADVTAAPVVTDVSPDETRRMLAWQAPRLQFDETPLAEAVAEFNSRNRHQLVLGDASLGALPVGGAFHPDNVHGFVRLLSITLNVRAEERGPDETVLYRGR